MSVRCLKAAWRKLWSDSDPPKDFEGFDDQCAELQEIITLANSMGLEMDAADVDELVEGHSRELTTEELQELHKEEAQAVQNVIASDEEEQTAVQRIDAQKLKDLFFYCNKVKEIVTDHHLDFASFQRMMNSFDDSVMNHFWDLQKKRLKQVKIDSFLTKVIRKSSHELEESAKRPSCSAKELAPMTNHK